jgi:hypothetical protein
MQLQGVAGQGSQLHHVMDGGTFRDGDVSYFLPKCITELFAQNA